MKAKFKNKTIKLYETKEVEVEALTPEEAIETLDLFMDALYCAVPDDLLYNNWSAVLRHMREYAQDACDNYNI